MGAGLLVPRLSRRAIGRLRPHCAELSRDVLRGGSWRNDASYARSASRAYYDTNVRYPAHGFRLWRGRFDENPVRSSGEGLMRVIVQSTAHAGYAGAPTPPSSPGLTPSGSGSLEAGRDWFGVGRLNGETRRVLVALIAAAGWCLAAPASAQTAAPPDAQVYIIYPHDGQRIRGPFAVRFGLRNMGVTHAGDTTANMGHHHLLVDAETKSIRTCSSRPTGSTCISALVRQKPSSISNRGRTRSNWSWATRSTSRSSPCSSRRKSPSRCSCHANPPRRAAKAHSGILQAFRTRSCLKTRARSPGACRPETIPV